MQINTDRIVVYIFFALLIFGPMLLNLIPDPCVREARRQQKKAARAAAPAREKAKQGDYACPNCGGIFTAGRLQLARLRPEEIDEGWVKLKCPRCGAKEFCRPADKR